MQHDHVLKKVNLTYWPIPRVGGGGGEVCGQPRCCILDSLSFDMQHDHVLQKFNFDLLVPSPGSGGGTGVLWAKYLLACCCFHYSL